MEIVNEIIKLKNEGLKISEISKRLNIPSGTIKSKLHRFRIKPTTEDKQVDTCSYDKCKECGSEIKVIKGKKAREFCSDYCRVKYWRKHRHE